MRLESSSFSGAIVRVLRFIKYVCDVLFGGKRKTTATPRVNLYQLNDSAILFAVLSLSILTVGCSPQEPTVSEISSTKYAAVESLSNSQLIQQEKAIAGKDKLFQMLLGELTKSVQANGPAESISVCKIRAPEIADAVGEELGIAIGRTSLKLRNEDNTSPAWAKSFVESSTEAPVSVELAQGKLGVLLPIKLKANCLVCHGPQENLDNGVVAALAENYPDDRATGFAEGDLRGYFWVEVDAETK